MKKITRFLITTTLLVMLTGGFLSKQSVGQIAPPPPPGEKGVGGNKGPLEGGAPMEEGAWILITLVMGYGIHKINLRKKHHLNREQDSDEE